MGSACASSLIMPNMNNFIIYKMFKTNPPLKQEKELDFNYTPPPTMLMSMLPMPRSEEGIKAFEKVLEKMDSNDDIEDLSNFVSELKSSTHERSFLDKTWDTVKDVASNYLEPISRAAIDKLKDFVFDEAGSILSDSISGLSDMAMAEYLPMLLATKFQPGGDSTQSSQEGGSFKIQSRQTQYLNNFLQSNGEALLDLGVDFPEQPLKAIGPSDLRQIANSLLISADLVEHGKSSRADDLVAKHNRKQEQKKRILEDEKVMKAAKDYRDAEEDKDVINTLQELRKAKKRVKDDYLMIPFLESLVDPSKMARVPKFNESNATVMKKNQEAIKAKFSEVSKVNGTEARSMFLQLKGLLNSLHVPKDEIARLNLRPKKPVDKPVDQNVNG